MHLLLFLLSLNITYIWDASPKVDEVTHYNFYIKTNTAWVLYAKVTNNTHITITNISMPFSAAVSAVNVSGESELSVARPSKVTIKQIIIEEYE